MLQLQDKDKKRCRKAAHPVFGIHKRCHEGRLPQSLLHLPDRKCSQRSLPAALPLPVIDEHTLLMS